MNQIDSSLDISKVDWSCKSTVLSLVKTSGYLLQYASEGLKDDREIVLASVKNFGFSLMHASKKLKDDRQLVLTAVRKDGCSLQHASARLKADKDIVENAVKDDSKAIKYAGQDFWKLPQIRKYLHSKGNPNELPIILLLENNKLGKYMSDEDYGFYHVHSGYIRVDGHFGCNDQGFYANLALYIPPVDRDVDAWEASRLAGQSDLWNFLKVFCCPASPVQAGAEIEEYDAVLGFKSSTFFDRPNEVLQLIELQKDAPELNEYVRGADTFPELDVVQVWKLFFELCEKKFGAKELPPHMDW